MMVFCLAFHSDMKPIFVGHKPNEEKKAMPIGLPEGATYMGYADQDGGCAFMGWYDNGRFESVPEGAIVEGVRGGCEKYS